MSDVVTVGAFPHTIMDISRGSVKATSDAGGARFETRMDAVCRRCNEHLIGATLVRLLDHAQRHVR